MHGNKLSIKFSIDPFHSNKLSSMKIVMPYQFVWYGVYNLVTVVIIVFTLLL